MRVGRPINQDNKAVNVKSHDLTDAPADNRKEQPAHHIIKDEGNIVFVFFVFKLFIC